MKLDLTRTEAEVLRELVGRLDDAIRNKERRKAGMIVSADWRLLALAPESHENRKALTQIRRKLGKHRKQRKLL